jgi:hypothetical protein
MFVLVHPKKNKINLSAADMFLNFFFGCFLYSCRRLIFLPCASKSTFSSIAGTLSICFTDNIEIVIYAISGYRFVKCVKCRHYVCQVRCVDDIGKGEKLYVL